MYSSTSSLSSTSAFGGLLSHRSLHSLQMLLRIGIRQADFGTFYYDRGLKSSPPFLGCGEKEVHATDRARGFMHKVVGSNADTRVP